jgi:hypothetical protein
MTDPKRRKPSIRKAPRKRAQTPEQAAEVFVRDLIRHVCGDFLDLVEDEGHDPAAREPDYANLKRAVRRQHRLPTHDVDRLRDQVVASVPEDRVEIAREALDAYTEAAADEFIVRENAAYILGVAVGRAFGGRVSLRGPF